MNTLRIGTRRSKLALAQAALVRDALVAEGVEAELAPMNTTGDEVERMAAGTDGGIGGGVIAVGGSQGLKGLWIDQLLDALESERIDLAVHSAKDLPAEDDDGLVVAAVPVRADPFDLLIMREASLPERAVIGTSSLRRRAQLLASFPGLEVVELHGNVDTRLHKLNEGDVDAVVLAAAGLARLGIMPAFATTLPLAQMVPAPGQGCLAVQCRDDDERTRSALAALDHPPSHAAFDVERSLMWRLGGGCALPLGAYAQTDENGIRLTAAVATPDGDRLIRVEEHGPDPESVASAAAKALIANGAEEILSEVRPG